MSLAPKIRLFIEEPLVLHAGIALDRDQTHYLANVMRVKLGSFIALFNGRDGEWLAEITSVSKKCVELLVVEQRRNQDAPVDLWLVFAPIKKARLDFMAQRATELGVSKLQPMVTQYTNLDRVKLERIAANAREAAEQCERLEVPEVGEILSLAEVLDSWPEERRIMFCDEDLSGKSVLEALNDSDDRASPAPWAILIGPEGGFDDSERARIKAMPQTTVVSLGPLILRADTAAIAAVSLWQSALGKW